MQTESTILRWMLVEDRFGSGFREMAFYTKGTLPAAPDHSERQTGRFFLFRSECISDAEVEMNSLSGLREPQQTLRLCACVNCVETEPQEP
jgi:hypothetical protein